MMEDAPLYVHVHFGEMSNAFQERHGTLAKQGAEECSLVLAFGRGLFLPLLVMWRLRGWFREGGDRERHDL
jgi:hypothetical protein